MEKIMKRLFVLFLFLISFNANAALVIVGSSETNVLLTSLTSTSISASGSGFSPFVDKTESDCCDGQESFFQLDFDVVGSQLVMVDAVLNSFNLFGSSNENMAQLRIQKNNPLVPNGVLEYILGAVSQAEESSLEGDIWVTDYTSDELILSREIMLSEGSYTLFARAFAEQIQSEGGSSYSFTLTTIPVPAAVWLFGSGMVTLFGFVGTRNKKY